MSTTTTPYFLVDGPYYTVESVPCYATNQPGQVSARKPYRGIKYFRVGATAFLRYTEAQRAATANYRELEARQAPQAARP